MPIITEYIDYECNGLLKKQGLKYPETVAKEFNIPLNEIIMIEKENNNGELSTFIRIPILKIMQARPTARQKFTYICDKCGKKVTTIIGSFLKEYKGVARKVPESLNDEILCKKCKTIKTNLERFGVKNATQSSEVKEKMKMTNLERYNVPYVSQNSETKEKIKQTNLKKYGVPYASQSLEIKEKVKQTNIERHGVPYTSQLPEIKGKVRQTNIEKYGFPCTFQSPEIKEKIKKTNLEKYGVPYAAQANEIKEKRKQTFLDRYGVSSTMEITGMKERIKEKIKETNLERYGVPCTLQIPEVRQKQMETMFKNGTVRTSKQQKRIFNLLVNANYTVALNYPVKGAFLDIAFLDTLHFCEYDGSGHNLGIKYHQFTSEEFKQRELRRSYMLRNAGWKEIRIISSNDKLPNDNTLLKMINLAREYLSNTKHTWIHVNLDKQCFIFTKEHITIPFDSLKTIL